ncbi:hypothetical protein VST7929_01528 [Vibrio stylophorae]|uniref:undecaprenyl-diphosphate phosphatase n=1 Tax=Vibrio stylophorae TaxID=659351 RepID=A0ABM8ZTL2_9VIBR|nr:phosphatase PAP2 family protein [Vibrio stylophorae]CAH0533657.1 hypothetical protein VST7929_01528 [Vibrio stylophorae]
MQKFICAFATASTLLLSANAHASNQDNWKTMSNIGSYGLVATAFLLPTYHHDWQGLEQAAWSVGSTSAVTLVGKNTIHAERPDKSDDDSFPSGHTANAFAAATTLYRRYGWEVGVPAYTVATLVGVGRVEAEKHYWRDVLAGAAIGTIAGWYFTDAFDDNVQLVPWAQSDGGGVMVTWRW